MNKYNDLVNRKRIMNAVRKELWDAVDRLHRKTRIPKSKLWDEAAELLLRKYGMEVPGEGGQDGESHE